MAGIQSKWRLEDVVDFEVLLSKPEGAAEARRYREQVGGVLADVKPGNERVRRRIGLRAWLDARRAEDGEEPIGARAVGALKAASLVLGLVAFVVGISVVRGLLVAVEFQGEAQRAYNIWVFLAVTVGLQWLLFLAGAMGYILVRRQQGTRPLLQRLVGALARRLGGMPDSAVWKRLTGGGHGYGAALSWRLARMTQGAAVGFNLGMLAGFFGCLWLFDVGFYWESTLMAPPVMSRLFDGLAWPWSWSGVALPRAWSKEEFSLLGKHFHEAAGGRQWWPYLAMCVVVWGLLPRLLAWVACLWNEKRALARLDFQEPRHRELWRHLTRVELSLATEGPEDGVVLLDVGGIGITTDAVKEFLLRGMRVNPEGHYEAAVLDAKAEAEAWRAIRNAPLGVVFLVEGWALSPKQMTAIYRRARAAGENRMLRFLVLGDIRDGLPGPPSDEDFKQWKKFVDGLRDPSAEVVAYEVPEPVGEQK